MLLLLCLICCYTCTFLFVVVMFRLSTKSNILQKFRDVTCTELGGYFLLAWPPLGSDQGLISPHQEFLKHSSPTFSKLECYLNKIRHPPDPSLDYKPQTQGKSYPLEMLPAPGLMSLMSQRILTQKQQPFSSSLISSVFTVHISQEPGLTADGS